MQSNLAVIILGVVLIVIGLGMIFGSRSRRSQTVSNVGGTVAGPVNQSISHVSQTAGGTEKAKSYDWVGWGLAAIGLVISAWGLFK